MLAKSVSPDPQCFDALQGADFADAFRLQTTEPGLDAMTAAERVMNGIPSWITALITVRNALVAPFGLKSGHEPLPRGGRRIGLFPLVSEAPGQVVLGMDDKHLDFRLVISAPGTGAITGTTLVRTHNLPGRIYLQLVLPFHRLIVPRMMRQILLPRG
ncbi:DUF2867 domain-containing protein [Bradyrhizobium prioriisuperbiae]|uniref:DUF2867 domain-containing protein n=1 Tax=Bradyrhizobium prioriisuperbiae TaxID=2854389 RepID=UPI0028F1302A|nr:DUF2867 domain-containing protein [Bradyrhizobium prioritasuperba]